MKIAIIAMVIALTGCSKCGNTQAEVSDGVGSGEVKLVELKDGTKCAVLIGYQKGGIHCNWNR